MPGKDTPGTDTAPDGLDVGLGGSGAPGAERDRGEDDGQFTTPNGLDFTYLGLTAPSVDDDPAGVTTIRQIQVTQNLGDIDMTKALAVYTIPLPCAATGPTPGSIGGFPSLPQALKLKGQLYIAVYA